MPAEHGPPIEQLSFWILDTDRAVTGTALVKNVDGHWELQGQGRTAPVRVRWRCGRLASGECLVDMKLKGASRKWYRAESEEIDGRVETVLVRLEPADAEEWLRAHRARNPEELSEQLAQARPLSESEHQDPAQQDPPEEAEEQIPLKPHIRRAVTLYLQAKKDMEGVNDSPTDRELYAYIVQGLVRKGDEYVSCETFCRYIGFWREATGRQKRASPFGRVVPSASKSIVRSEDL